MSSVQPTTETQGHLPSSPAPPHADPARGADPASPAQRSYLDAKRLARWFWLRLASGAAAQRDRESIEPHVRDALVAIWETPEDEATGDRWEALVAKLAARAEAEATVARAILERLRARLAPIAGPMQLDTTACDVLILGVALSRDLPLERLGREFVLERDEDVIALVAEVIDASEARVAEVLHVAGTLHRDRLIAPRKVVAGLRHAIEPIGGLRWGLFGHRPLDRALIHRFCRPLDLESAPDVDLSHHAESVRIVQAFLRTGPKARVLLHGKPGVGKTEFVRQVVRRLGWSAFVADLGRLSDREFFDAESDLGHELAGAVLRGRPETLLVLDHAGGLLYSSGPRLREYLDRLEVPNLWISADLDLIDADVLSRFDYILQIDTPPRAVRLGLLQRSLAPLGVSDPVLEQVAGSETFLPTDVRRLARSVPVLVAEGIPADEATLVLVAREPRTARAPTPARGTSALPYRLEWIHAKVEIERLIAGLTRTGAGTLLFTGPPGTGKTALARHLATRLSRPLLVRGASDLNQPYIGQTEQAMAKAFAEATQQGAILLIDEIDSLLRTRESAQRTWEVSQVNEMLTQLDQFTGIAIFTTNAVDTLDSAVMRRIDRKIEFDYVARPRRLEVFTAAATTLGLPAPEPGSALAREVETLSALALGDVSVVLRGERLEPSILDAAGLYRALAREIGRRTRTKGPMGFVPV